MTGQYFALFDTAIGRCGIVWGERGITGVQLPMGSEEKTRTRIRQSRGDIVEAPPPIQVQQAIDGMVVDRHCVRTGRSGDLDADRAHVGVNARIVDRGVFKAL